MRTSHNRQLGVIGYSVSGSTNTHTTHDCRQCHASMAQMLENPHIYAAHVTDILHMLYQAGKASRVYRVWPIGQNVREQEGGGFPAWFTPNPRYNAFVVCIGNNRSGELHKREEIDAWLNMLQHSTSQ